jgi:hypothetical protein
MIFHSANDNGLASVIGQDAAEIAVQFLAELLGAQKRTAVFGRENGVDQNFCEGLRQGVRMLKPGA